MNASFSLTPTQASLIAAHKARQARFAAAARRIPQEPKNERVKLIAANECFRNPRAWEIEDLYFDAHVDAYKRWHGRIEAMNGCPHRQFIHQRATELGSAYHIIVSRECTTAAKRARAIIAFELYDQFDLSHTDVGRLMNRDRTTARHIINTGRALRGE